MDKTNKIVVTAASIICIFFVGFMFFSLTRDSYEPDCGYGMVQKYVPAPPRFYIALGDSIPSGYGLPGYIQYPEGRHTAIFFDKLYEAGHIDEYWNKAISGFTTSMLLAQLHGLSGDELENFHNAAVITVNVGGNNVLTPFLAYLANLQAVMGAENLASGAGTTVGGAWGIISEIIAGLSGLAYEGDTDFDPFAILAGFGDIVAGLGELVMGTGNIMAGTPNIISTWMGLLSPELTAQLESGVQGFVHEFTEIIAWLEAHAPHATIIVNTIYNPIPREIAFFNVPIALWADELLDTINHAIYVQSVSRGFMVTDLRDYLTNRPELTHFNLNPFDGEISFDVVHPNAEGHVLIARLNYETFSVNFRDS